MKNIILQHTIDLYTMKTVFCSSSMLLSPRKCLCRILWELNAPQQRSQEHYSYEILLLFALISQEIFHFWSKFSSDCVLGIAIRSNRFSQILLHFLATCIANWGFACKISQFLKKVIAVSASAVCSATKFRFIFRPNEVR